MEDPGPGRVGDQVLHHDPGDLGADRAEHRHHQIVGERTIARDARQPGRDTVGLIRSDPDRQQPVRIARLQQDHMLSGEDVDAYRLDAARDEHQKMLAVPRVPRGSSAAEQEQQQDPRDEAEDVRVIRDVRGRGVRGDAQLRDPFEALSEKTSYLEESIKILDEEEGAVFLQEIQAEITAPEVL